MIAERKLVADFKRQKHNKMWNKFEQPASNIKKMKERYDKTMENRRWSRHSPFAAEIFRKNKGSLSPAKAKDHRYNIILLNAKSEKGGITLPQVQQESGKDSSLIS